MSYTLKKKIAARNNYGSKRSTGNIKYIVIHYTGNDGDTDENNSKYFAERIVKASAHYFVDSDSVTQSVPDDYAAYSVGGSRYSNYKQTGGAKYYKKATNSNSLNIELCDDIKNGVVYPADATIENALAFVKAKMKQYSIPADRVIRHFDVTGKSCPAYWTNNDKWNKEFLNKLGGAVAGSNNIGSSSGSTSSGGKKESALGKGDRGTAVKNLQTKLIACGFSCGGSGADGIFGDGTDKAVRAFQKAYGLSVDGLAGKNTLAKLSSVYGGLNASASGSKKNNWISELQTECNKQGFSNQKVDGIAGKNTLKGCPTLKQGASGNITKILQKRLIALGYSCGSAGADGKFGSGTVNAVKKFQKAKGLSTDGIVGQNTWRKLLGL